VQTVLTKIANVSLLYSRRGKKIPLWRKPSQYRVFPFCFWHFQAFFLFAFCGCFWRQNLGIRGPLAVQSYWEGWRMRKISAHPSSDSKGWLKLCHLCGTESRSLHMEDYSGGWKKMILCPIYFLWPKGIPAGTSSQFSGTNRYLKCSYSIVTLPGSHSPVSHPQLFSFQLVVTFLFISTK